MLISLTHAFSYFYLQDGSPLDFVRLLRFFVHGQLRYSHPLLDCLCKGIQGLVAGFPKSREEISVVAQELFNLVGHVS